MVAVKPPNSSCGLQHLTYHITPCPPPGRNTIYGESQFTLDKQLGPRWDMLPKKGQRLCLQLTMLPVGGTTAMVQKKLEDSQPSLAHGYETWAQKER